MLGCKHAGHILLRTILCWKEIRTKKYFFQIVCLTCKHKQRKIYLSKNVPQAQWIRESCSDGGGGCIDCHLFPVSVPRFTKYYYAEFALQLSTICHVDGNCVSICLNLFYARSFAILLQLQFRILLSQPTSRVSR